MLKKANIVPHLLVFAVFAAIALAYFSPILSGKRLNQTDNIQLTGSEREVHDYRADGEQILWSNKEFSGMPKVSGWEYSPFRQVYLFLQTVLKRPLLIIFALFFGFYFLLHSFDVKPWLAGVGGFAYTFSTFNILSIEAGHDFKVLAIALMAPVLAGLFLIIRKKAYFKGGIALFVSSGLQLYFGHVQITYYLLIACLIYGVFELVNALRTKQLKSFFASIGVVALMVFLAFGTHAFKYIYLYQYGKHSTRGGSNLESAENKDGLSKDYAFAWSNEAQENLTLLFPYAMGGGSSESLDSDSEMGQVLRRNGVNIQVRNQLLNNAPLYWGNQPFTGGPVYFGVLVFLFFLFSLFYLKDYLKWWGLVVGALGVLLAMGDNAALVSNFFFDYIPLYNKFRSVTMILCLPQLVFSFLGFVALDRYLNDEKGKIKDWKWPLIVVGGLCLLLLLFKGTFDYVSPKDAQLGFPDWLNSALQDDREKLFSGDILRALFFLVACAIVLFARSTGKMKSQYVILVFGVLILFDLWTVNRRYLDADDFTKAKNKQAFFTQSDADREILEDKTHYRVFNLTVNPFSDGLTSYHHFSAGGYSGIKLQRYQELIDAHLSKLSQPVLNMLNVKYLIVENEGKRDANENVNALGNAWFAKTIKEVNGAEAELSKIGEFSPEEEVVIDVSSGFKPSRNAYNGEGEIQLGDYHPERMVYNSSSKDDQLAVFSEVYYQPGWTALIDGEEVPHYRVNYLLRGLELPAGDHEIVFVFEPTASRIGPYIELTSFLSAMVFLSLIFFRQRRKG